MAISFEGKENVTLDDLRWKNRIVLYFPSPDQNPKFEFDAIEEKLNERKIIFLSIGDVFTTNSKLVFTRDYLQVLQEKYSTEKGQGNWLLIGLDGGVKETKMGEPDWDFIFKTIDSMPMRQSEIRKIN
ncbi:DUF4174 domain-containing protein [Cognataquiflexum rubidum]|uniref:DUF4174 domain-containing protein n=1 Tax=Cognataquiflexum rubidum TaxID=2922273 RepID=UPI001F13BFB4|nr:DUF4174 domain-containing protein [Cognataquiflexum rubidum]MCH6234370.1 DUF4174 domain-containing protein [Cognataquiflexum rubidum]